MRRLAGLALTLLLLSGCGGRELADVALVEVLGFDAGVTVTAREGGEDGEVFSAVGGGAPEAQGALKLRGTRRVELTHVGWVVLGPGVDVGEVLWQELRERESGYGATVWLSPGPAAALVEESGDLAGRLGSLEKNAGVKAPTILEAVSELSRKGRVTLPVVAVVDGEAALVGWRTVEGAVEFE